MAENIVFAVGYPIGFIAINDDEYYNIQLNDKAYPVNLLSAYVWLEALKGGRTKIDIIDSVLIALQEQGYKLGEDFTLENLEFEYDALLALSLLIEIDSEAVESLLEKYPKIAPFRVGFGVGIDFDEITIHHESEDVKINPIEYYIWQLSNGFRTLDTMYEEHENAYKIVANFEPKDTNNELELLNLKKLFVKAVIELHMNNLIYIVNI